tara:strand:- start:323 stop:580 length:258 start_codon:yes stop_codon:yes gene_type:complete
MNRPLAYFLIVANMFIPLFILGCCVIVGIGWGFYWLTAALIVICVYTLFKDGAPLNRGGPFAMWNPNYVREWLAAWDQQQRKKNE